MKLIYSLAFVFLLLTPALFWAAQAQNDDVEGELETDLKQEKVALKTDDNVVDREEQQISNEGFSIAEKKLLEGKEQKYEFQAEITRLMQLLVNSLYSNRDVFLREVISNASDALDKIRFLSLTDKSQLGEGDQTKLEIRILPDPTNRLLHIRDTGIGMTKDELVGNLGKIAKSGTKEWIDKLSKGDNLHQIGQFGVGFYSTFLAADKVTVTTKHNNDSQYIWESTGEGDASYTVVEDPRGNTLGRGTLITLHLKDDAEEFLDQDKLKDLITKYSEFINFPIYLQTKKTISEEVPIEEEEEEKTEEVPVKEDKPTDEAEIEEDEEEEEEEKPKTKTVSKTVYEWELINETKPIWTRRPAEVTEEEYQSFYVASTKDHGGALAHIHFSAEGDVEFSSLLYVPNEPPFGMFDSRIHSNSKVKLYVRRVFITDKFEELMPKYLSFISGIVDSDDLPLNVSREMLQQHKALQVIKKRLVRKAIAMFQELVDDEAKYEKFYQAYSTNLKLGCIEDLNNRGRLSKLLRFYSAKHKENIGLEKYVKGMKEGQDVIYYLGGETKESLAKSPLLERLTKKGYDVLFLTEPMDEYVMQTLQKFDNKYKFVDVGKEGLKLDDEEELKAAKEEFKPLTDFLKEKFSKHLEKVQVSSRLASTPCALISSSHGHSANMERILRAQALADARYKQMMAGSSKKTLEINPKHPVIKELLKLVTEEDNKEKAGDVAEVLYETAAISSGFALQEPTAFADRIFKMAASSLDIAESDLQTFKDAIDAEPFEEDTPVAEESTNEDSQGAESENSKDEL